MPITGTQPALTEARVGMMRVGGSRVGYVLPIPAFTINGTVRTSDVRLAGVSVRDILNGTPNTATFRVDGFTPTEGHEVILAFGTSPTQFRGRILSTNKIYEGKPANVALDCQCISEEWLLNRRKVTRRYLSTSATSIIIDIFTSFTSGFSTAGVASGLPSLDEITFTNEDVTDCLDRICQRIGEDWQLDYAKVLHVPAGDGQSANAITDTEDHGMSGIAVTTDLSQVRTRQSGEGGGSVASTDVAVGQTTIPVDDSTWYNAAGGMVKSGPQFIAYTGKSTLDGTGSKVGGKAGLAPGTPSAAMVSGTAGNLSTGVYRHVVSFLINGGETEVGNNSSATITSVSAPGALTATTVSETAGNLSVGAYTYRVTYVTATGETEAGTVSGTASVTYVPDENAAPSVAATTGGSLTNGVAYSYKVSFTTALGETIAWQQSASVTMSGGNNAVSLTNIPVSGDDRVTGRKIYRHGTLVGPAHDWALVATIANNTATTHTDTVADASVGVPPQYVNTASSGRIDLTAIPTSGDGRVTARRIYRTLVNGSAYKFLTTINGNVTTTYSDNTADASLGVDAPSVNASGGGQIDLTNIPIGPAGTTGRRIYRSPVNVVSIPSYKLLTTINNNTATTFTDNVSDVGLGAVLAPEVSTVGPSAGDTALVSQNVGAHGSSGWVNLAGQLVRYTGTSGSTLTGIPASGIGAITAAVPFDTPIINAPHLTGVSGIIYAINKGEDVNIWVTRNDTAAQTFMAAAVGGDGIHEADPIQDRRMSETEITARCDAKLAELSTPLATVRYLTRDITTTSGRDVTVTLSAPTNISGTFRIQSVTTTGFHPTVLATTHSAMADYRPLRQVECSSRRLSFEQLLRIIKAS